MKYDVTYAQLQEEKRAAEQRRFNLTMERICMAGGALVLIASCFLPR